MFLNFITMKRSHLRVATGLDDEIFISPSVDELPEIKDALSDVDEAIKRSTNPRSGLYWQRIKETLLANSASQDIDEAIKEWDREGFPYISRETCQLCGKTPIKFVYPIKNRVSGNQLIVGCECVYNYLEISGYESPQELKKTLISHQNVLEKEEKGLTEPGELDSAKQVDRLVQEVRGRLSLVDNGVFDLDEYFEALNSVLTICNNLDLQDQPAVKAAAKALKASYALKSFADKEIRKKQKFSGYQLKAILEKILAKREKESQRLFLETFLTKLNKLFEIGRPNDVITRVWSAVEVGRNRLVAQVEDRCTKGKAELTEATKNAVAIVKPYSYLSFLLNQGIKSLKGAFDTQLEQVTKAVDADDFLEQLKASSSRLKEILSYTFYPDLANADGAAERAAYKTIQFVDAISKGNTAINFVVTAIEDTYRLNGVQIRDLAGVRVALLRAADDSAILDVDVLGEDAVHTFASLIREKNLGVLELIQIEVDEVAKLVRETGNLKVYELMGEQLNFEVEKYFKLYTSDKAFEEEFCTRILDDWTSGRLRELSIARLENLHQQWNFKHRQKEVRNSMWGKLKSRLTARVSQGTYLK